MFYGLAAGKIDTRGWEFRHVLQDIQTLNDRALRGELDITAISIHTYPYVADKYILTNCGASMGDGYGPMVVAREPLRIGDLWGKRIAIPGLRTTAFLALQLLLRSDHDRPVAPLNPAIFMDKAGHTAREGGWANSPPVQFEAVMFDQILRHVEEGRADAGLVIHEGQLTYWRHKLHLVVDLGAWWKSTTGLPLPLGGNVLRRELGRKTIEEVAAVLKQSIEYSLAHRAEAVGHAMQYARDMGRELADRFVGMYVNEWTLDYGETGREAIRALLRAGHHAGLLQKVDRVDFV
jgi:1,4-dihydroxy-6-naphthoate synthase